MSFVVSGRSSVAAYARLLAGVFGSATWLRWVAVAGVFAGVNIALLAVLRESLGLPIALATVLAAEASTLLRFVANEQWVFQQQRPTWGRLWRFHVTQAASFATWVLVTAGLGMLGVHYAVASLAGNCATVALSMPAHFLWVWRPVGVPGVPPRRPPMA